MVRNKSTMFILLVPALILLVPLVAMQFTNEVVWGPIDFAVAWLVMAGTGFAYKLATRRTDNPVYRIAAALALAGAFLLIWINLAVGLIGSEDNPANLMYFGLLALGIIGAFIARSRADGMARTLVAMAIAQGLIAVITLSAGLGSEGENWPQVIVVLNGFFAALWLISAWLFRQAARERNLLSAS